MAGASPLLRRLLFGHPEGVLGRLGGLVMARMNREAAVWVIGLLDIRPTDRILEIGFGPGVGIQLLAERASAGRVSGIDASPVMLEQAVARNREAIGTGRVQLQLGAADRLPFADASFDKVMAINSMQMWPDQAAALRETKRALKVAGRIAVVLTPLSGQSKSGMGDTLVKAGFTAPGLMEKGRTFCWLATKA
jgi:ubiquinone/menaquinone biosynthesis C-methylase UbiE